MISFCGHTPWVWARWLSQGDSVHADDLDGQGHLIAEERRESTPSALCSLWLRFSGFWDVKRVSQAVRGSCSALLQITIQNGLTAWLLFALHLLHFAENICLGFGGPLCMDSYWVNGACSVCCGWITAGSLPSHEASCTTDSRWRKRVGFVPQNVVTYMAGTMAWWNPSAHPVSLVT